MTIRTATPARLTALLLSAASMHAGALAGVAQPSGTGGWTAAARIDSILDAPAFHNTSWGALILDAERGDTVYARNATRLFVPGSNQKIVTTAVALVRLGPGFRFTTRLASSATVDNGTLMGDLVVFGTGDPSFSDHMRGGDGMAPLRDMADSLLARGILRVDGALRRGTPAFTDSPIGFGWAWEDLAAAYGAPVGDLMFNEAFATTRVTVDGVRDSTALARRRDPQHFLDALYTALRDRGISVRGGFDWATISDDTAAATLVAYASPPLDSIVEHLQKESQNQIAEVLLKTLGRLGAGAGRADSGSAVVARQLVAWGADSTAFVVRDGSGLSRHNWLTPQVLARVLLQARGDSAFQRSLPVAGVDGTLELRMRATPAAGNARAKTGSMDRVRALSGYVTTAGGRPLVFVLLINGFTVPAREVEQALDRIVALLASLPAAS